MSSSILSGGNAPAQRVPAWKRLGLQLKSASEEQGQQVSSPHNSSTSTAPSASGAPNSKRKSSGAPALEQLAKRPKQDNSQDRHSAHTPKKAKSISFTAEATETRPPARANGTHLTKKQNKSSPKKAAAPPAKPIKQAPVNLEPALAYLRLWHTSRDTWKFNKNHQTKLLEQVFADETTIPAADISIFYEYISGLKGAVRDRLKELANGTKAQDMERGSDGFPAAKEGAKGTAEKKQAEYESVVKTYLGRERTPDKRRFDEVEYVLRTADMEMQRRVVKRMRAEMVLDELSISDDAEAASTATAATEKGESSSRDAQNASNHAGGDGGAEGDKRLKLNDGSQQRVRRKRKLRTAAVEDETSSESESESESESDSSTSDSSSSSSSDSEGEDVGNATVPGPSRNGADTSSSSSSSSSESESDDEEEEDDD